jgi:hypothetical protein
MDRLDYNVYLYNCRATDVTPLPFVLWLDAKITDPLTATLIQRRVIQ